jgi:hypothetical protein
MIVDIVIGIPLGLLLTVWIVKTWMEGQTP